MSNKVVVSYIGNSIYQDAKKESWAKNHTNPDIKSSRTYSSEEYESRSDLQFMVEYGEMTKFDVEDEDKKAEDKKEDKVEDKKEDKVEDKKEDKKVGGITPPPANK